MIVDTSFVLDLIDGDGDAFEKGRELTDSGTPLIVPTMTITELFVGYGATEDDEEARLVENVLRGYPVAELDEVTARKAGWMAGRTGVGLGDAVIGATAAIRDEQVLTRNLDDFEALGVAVETY